MSEVKNLNTFGYDNYNQCYFLNKNLFDSIFYKKVFIIKSLKQFILESAESALILCYTFCYF